MSTSLGFGNYNAGCVTKNVRLAWADDAEYFTYVKRWYRLDCQATSQWTFRTPTICIRLTGCSPGPEIRNNLFFVYQPSIYKPAWHRGRILVLSIAPI